MTTKSIFLQSILLLAYVFCWAQKTTADKYRVLIMTDMTHDDGNSLIRYLYYANDFDLEGIIVTPQLPDYNYDAKEPWQKAQNILEGYKSIYPNLLRHSKDFPTYEQLQRVTKRGRGALPIIWLTNTKVFSGEVMGRPVKSSWGDINFHDWIGEGNTPNGESKDSEGSEYLQKVFDKDDDRPIYVQMWGGPITFVQALYRYKQRQGDEKFSKLLKKLHVFGILLQDITFDYLISIDDAKMLGCGDFGNTQSSYRGERVHPAWLLFDGGHFWRYIKVMKEEEVNGNDSMSANYDHGGEGDTPSFLYLLSANLGLNDPLQPAQGSWGSLFTPMPETFPKGYYSTCGVEQSELERWIPDAKNSFLARMKWATSEPSSVNHPPVSALGKDRSNKVIYMRGSPGKKVRLDASASSDPDGDNLSYKWFHYTAASTYKNKLNLGNSAAAVIDFAVPKDIGNENIHLVVEVRDDGKPSLVSYRRVVIAAK